MSEDEDFQEEFKNIYKGMKLDVEDEIVCAGCKKNFKESHKNEMLITHGSQFISGFSYEENSEDAR